MAGEFCKLGWVTDTGQSKGLPMKIGTWMENEVRWLRVTGAVETEHRWINVAGWREQSGTVMRENRGMHGNHCYNRSCRRCVSMTVHWAGRNEQSDPTRHVKAAAFEISRASVGSKVQLSAFWRFCRGPQFSGPLHRWKTPFWSTSAQLLCLTGCVLFDATKNLVVSWLIKI